MMTTRSSAAVRLLIVVVALTAVGVFAEAEGAKAKKESKVVRLTKNNWDFIVKDITKNVFVKFYTPWCKTCKAMDAEWEDLADKYSSDKVIIAEIDAEKYPEVAKKQRVSSYPTLVLYPRTNKGGKFYMGTHDIDHMGRFIRANPV